MLDLGVNAAGIVKYYLSHLIYEKIRFGELKTRAVMKGLNINIPLSGIDFIKKLIKGLKTHEEKKEALLNFSGHKNIDRGKELIEVRVKWIIHRKKEGLKTIEIFNKYQSVFKRARVTFDKDLALANKRIKYLM